MTTRLVCANKVKLTKIALSQNTRMIKKGVGIEPPVCANNNNGTNNRTCRADGGATAGRDAARANHTARADDGACVDCAQGDEACCQQ